MHLTDKEFVSPDQVDSATVLLHRVIGPIRAIDIMQSIFSSAARLRGSMVGKKPWKPRR